MTDDFDAEWEDALRHVDEDEYDEEHHHDPHAVEDAHLAETVADRALRGRYCWAAGLDWMAYRHGCWVPTTEANISEKVRRDLIGQQGREANAGAPIGRLKQLIALLSATRIRAVVTLARGILEVAASDFDQQPDLLNVGNGVVDLATGELMDHDPALMLTKTTPVHYVPGATSPDWDAALEAVPADVAAWLQVRVGQAATGHPTPDDVLCLLQGGGANGKTTVTGAIHRALGQHAVMVPERLLLSNPGDHPTELMTLRGARFAMIEETPEARHLSVKRLKDTVGTPTMTARLIRRDNVTWEATHSLFITTNYLPRIDETDHGTWRRLAMVRFPYRFTAAEEITATKGGGQEKVGIPGLRERLRDGREGQHEAVLAWVVAGARQWYELHRVMPPAPQVVKDDTLAWRTEADLVCGYFLDRLVLDPNAHVISKEMYDDFCTWLLARGHRAWGDQMFTDRFGQHSLVQGAGVEKRQVRARDGLSRPASTWHTPTGRYRAWLGLRYRTDADDHEDSAPPPDLRKQSPGKGGKGCAGSSDVVASRGVTKQPLAPLATCTVCSTPLDRQRAAAGETTHGMCEWEAANAAT